MVYEKVDELHLEPSDNTMTPIFDKMEVMVEEDKRIAE
jgi:hypothetical protein